MERVQTVTKTLKEKKNKKKEYTEKDLILRDKKKKYGGSKKLVGIRPIKGGSKTPIIKKPSSQSKTLLLNQKQTNSLIKYPPIYSQSKLSKLSTSSLSTSTPFSYSSKSSLMLPFSKERKKSKSKRYISRPSSKTLHLIKKSKGNIKKNTKSNSMGERSAYIPTRPVFKKISGSKNSIRKCSKKVIKYGIKYRNLIYSASNNISLKHLKGYCLNKKYSKRRRIITKKPYMYSYSKSFLICRNK